MAENQKLLDAIMTQLPDNTTELISPQDLRDAVRSVMMGHGEIYISSSAATTISDTVSFFDAAGTYALSPDAYRFDMNTNGQLRYTGEVDSVVHIAASVSLTAAGTNKLVEMAIAKNGTTGASSIMSRQIGTGSDVGATALHWFTRMAPNDYLTFQFKNLSTATDITAESLNLFAMSMTAMA